MFENTIEKIVNNLIQLDVDAIHAYTEAIAKIMEKEIKEQLKEFQEDHKRHVKELSLLLKEMGGEPIEPSQDVKGYLIEGITKLRSITGTEGALSAMVMNEKITNSKYSEALEHTGFTQELRRLIQANYSDEKKHLEYVSRTLETLKEKRKTAESS